MSSSTVDSQSASATVVRISADALTVELIDGRSISVPLAWFPRLSHGSLSERSNWRLIAGGHGIHWPDLDEDISVEGLLSGKPSGESQASFKKWLAQHTTHVIKQYRKRKDADTWHFCTNCSMWPTTDYDESAEKPAAGELCNECSAKYSAATCLA